MLAVTATKYTDPSNYELSEVLPPTVADPHDVVFQIKAASINPVDVKLVSGVFKMVLKQEYGNTNQNRPNVLLCSPLETAFHSKSATTAQVWSQT